MKMIVRLSIALALAALIITPILAADLNVTKTPPAPARDAPMTVGGFYVLGQIGVGQAKGNLNTDATSIDGTGSFCKWYGEEGCYKSKTFTTSTAIPAGYAQDNVIGLLFGAGVGYNWQQNNWVLGVEADAAGSLMRGYINNNFGNVEHRIPFLANVTGRVMYLVTPQLGVFVKGGLALAQFNTDVAGLGSASNFKAGWTVGTGLETKIPGTVLFARIEADYARFADQTLALPGLVTTLKGDVWVGKVAIGRGL